jgi:hydrogenase/urease accessory protein HupE
MRRLGVMEVVLIISVVVLGVMLAIRPGDLAWTSWW